MFIVSDLPFDPGGKDTVLNGGVLHPLPIVDQQDDGPDGKNLYSESISDLCLKTNVKMTE